MKRLIPIAMTFFFVFGCATPKMWIVSSDSKGGVIAYSGYTQEYSHKWLDDVKSNVQCPEAVVLQEWERKSITTQESMIVPVQNSSQTTTNGNYSLNNSFNENLYNINHKEVSNTKSTSYEVVPYSNTETWIEQKYICDLEKLSKQKFDALSADDKLLLHQNKCKEGIALACRILIDLYAQNNDELSSKMISEKLCISAEPRFGAGACVKLAIDAAFEKKQDLHKDYLKKGCEIVKTSNAKIEDAGERSCTFYGAITKNEKDFNIGLPVLLNRCAENKKECYDLACAYSIFGKKSKSIEYLKISLDAGFDNWSHIDQDPDLKNIRGIPEYKELIKQYRTRMPANVPKK